MNNNTSAPESLTMPTLNFSHLPVINFALQQNYVPVIRELTLTNNSGEDWKYVTVEITSQPGFTQAWKQSIELLNNGESFSFKQFPLRVNPQYLASLTEKVTGEFTVIVTANEVELYKELYKIDLLAYDQWNGIVLLPEMISAFITPNHPEIPNIIRKAAAILEKWTGSPSFDEYQSRNPNRVRKQMAAIYEVIAEMQLIYCSVPASFEESGQRVRLADAIFANKLANCLDLSLIYAACLEAVGIHAIITIVKGHAFAGAWLINESFADAVNDDPSLITKRTAAGINEIALVECTCMNAGNQIPFDEASALAEQKMFHTDDFVLFIDVKRARFSGIRPLPLRISTSSGWEIKEETKVDRENVLPQDIFVSQKLVHTDKVEVTKQVLWERKLLDLSLRNSLLNVRITKSVIQFITINVNTLEDALANGEEFHVLSKPTDWDNALRDTGLYMALHHSDPISDLVKHELAHRRIRTYLPENDLQAGLTNIYRSSRLALEENGANTLYIAMGMLKWYETEASERARYAPILLIPVEIIRKSAQRGYVIRSREEETIMNITLLEMLRQDFGITIGGLESLPRDESGVDVKAVFNIIRQAVMAKARWDVEEQALLGTFSFSKFILWNDIHHNADKLARNKVVGSLISGKLQWQAEAVTSNTEILDGQLHPAEIALPISTDSSQLHAIVSSGQEKSFVLHGPPGTGKSQTITNIIANALYAGKRVLFVAAKKAALEVVENRLESIGLGPFCLELHSNKSKKSAVLEQIKTATEIVNRPSPENFKQEADRLFELRNELNIYVETVHKRHSFGYSLFDLFTAYSQLPVTEDQVFFVAASIEYIEPAQLTAWQDLAQEMQTIAKIIGSPQTHPLRALKLTGYSAQLKQEARLKIEQFILLSDRLEKQTSLVRKIFKLDDVRLDKEQEEALAKLASLFLKLNDIPASLLKTDTLEQTMAQVIGIIAHGKQRDVFREGLLKEYNEEILIFPAIQSRRDWNIADEKWFLPRWMKQNSLLKNLKKFSLTGHINKQDVQDVLQRVVNYQQEQEFVSNATWLPALLGFMWQNDGGDWEAIGRACEMIIEINRTAAIITGVAQVSQWRSRVAMEWMEGSKIYTALHAETLEEFLRLTQQLKSTEAGLQSLLGIDFATLYVRTDNTNAELVKTASQWLQHIDSLKDWYNWTAIREKSVSAGLLPLITPFENGLIEADEIVEQYQKGFYRSAADYIIDKTPQLSTFNSNLFSEKIKKFRDLSKQFETLTKQELYARLAAKIPNFTQEASQSSEIGLLQRTLRNNGRAMSIRKIFDAIPNLLPRLTPCMLMSPISVAQYFDADSVKFDLVIFDEASQMPTCEAVGAIARGNNVIIVGDPRQMPPTNFFSSNHIDEENIEKEDLESILDDCLGLSMPSQYLLWHYRSKHESLIAFSNARYYDNKLLTFPSTDDISSKVQFIHVDGFYDKGKTRQNHNEAKAVVEEVIRRLSDPALAKRSMGIVTFSSVQQSLIEDLLTEVFALRSDLEKIALESQEPLFIKNLENVQGDERDVILFSVGYGPDKEGKISLNFGPINREGGWRRLNVAVSRARYEMQVFSTLRADQIDLNRTGSEGVAGLKAFLAYAEKGKTSLPLPMNNKKNEASSFETIIAKEISKKGFEVHTHIGCSSYKIDIAIVDPADSSKYILAILTDGKNYYSASTSKDREIVQVETLKLLGWNVHKIWSTEWWENPGKVLNEILEAIRQAEENNIQPEPYNTTDIKNPEPQETAVLNSLAVNVIQSEQINLPQVSSSITYEICEVEIVLTTSIEDFLMYHNREKIKMQIAQILQIESPISKNLLSKRILSAWGILRLSPRIGNHLDALFKEMLLISKNYGKNTFFWRNDQDPEEYNMYRIAQSELQKREADDLPPEEVANAVREVLKNQISLPKSELIRETSKLFSFARIGANVENAMMLGINKTIEAGYARNENDRVIYVE